MLFKTKRNVCGEGQKMKDYFKILQQTNNDEKDDIEKQALKSTTTISSIKSSSNYKNDSNNFNKFERSPYNRKSSEGFSFDTDAKKTYKTAEFEKKNGNVFDPYTGEKLSLTRAEAKELYKDDYAKHLAAGDHITPLKHVYEKNQKSAWLTDQDIRDAANRKHNIEAISTTTNSKKGDKTNREFLGNKENRPEEISNTKAIKGVVRGDISEAMIQTELTVKKVKHMSDAFHESGKKSVEASLSTSVSMSSISNIIAFLKGDKTADEAITDSAVDIGKSAATSYAISGGLTVVSRTLEVHGKNNAFLKSLSDNNVPAKVVSAVMMTGKTIKRYAEGEIDTQECIIELGESGITCLTSSAGMAVGTGIGMNISLAVGQTIIPIPVIGAAIGAMIGAAVTSSIFGDLTDKLNQKQIDHEERLRIIAEKTALAELYRMFQKEIQSYYDKYLLDCRICYESALSSISNGLQSGNINEVISGSNQIIRKNGGEVLYNDFDEFLKFISDDNPRKY